MSSTAAERAAAHRRAVEEGKRLERLTSLHRRGWTAATVSRAPDRGAPAAPAPPRAPAPASAAAYAQPMLRAIPRWYWGERRVAHEIAARQAAEADRRAVVAHQHAVAAHERRVAAHRAELDRLADERAAERLLERAHERLANGDRGASSRAISAALRDLPAPARLCGWHGQAAVVALRAPGPRGRAGARAGLHRRRQAVGPQAQPG